MRLRAGAGHLKYVVLFVVYAAAVAAYVWYTSPNRVPESLAGSAADPSTFFAPGLLRDSETLNAWRNWIFFMSGPWEWLIYFILLASGISRKWRDILEGYGLPVYIRFPLFVLLVNAVSFLLYLPLRVMSYNLSKMYGISTQPVSGWLRDKAVEFGIGYLTLLAVSAVAFWMISRGGKWWLKLWLISIPFTVFMMYVQPVVIDPIYNSFSTLSDPRLEQEILALAAKADIPAHRVYEVNMSEKTNAMNAYVNGIGSSLRIVLWDTTLQQLNEKEILLIMAHEMGHYVMHHLEWSAVGAVGSTLVLLLAGGWVFQVVVRNRGRSWGIRSMSDMSALPLVLLLLSVLSFAILPVTNYVSRQAEASADRYAMELIGSAEGSVSMNQKMSVVVLSDVNPPLLVKWFRDDHPSDMERIIDAERFERDREK
ncbi:M48 family metallopeptidase [Cohnella lupini]|uniref:Zn-dependent protease with chaperone function n=1 Tax=Cohnella lupini TaxID=1294267 RepID=A0A3D9IUY1_9BACL|nr:M48 family metallopeptidase [Cohnella lupini]RED65541.1 Zn-dependent protease with chaperone function [Cohnella lupini]